MRNAGKEKGASTKEELYLRPRSAGSKALARYEREEGETQPSHHDEAATEGRGKKLSTDRSMKREVNQSAHINRRSAEEGRKTKDVQSAGPLKGGGDLERH